MQCSLLSTSTASDRTRSVPKIHFVPRLSLLQEPWIKCYYGFWVFFSPLKKRQSLVAVCSKGSLHFPLHTQRRAESKARLRGSMSPLLSHQSCSFCAAQWHRGARWGGGMLESAENHLTTCICSRNGHTHTHARSHIHTHASELYFDLSNGS